jgi:CubicO group peptidase (beta-lactamase class C family)
MKMMKIWRSFGVALASLWFATSAIAATISFPNTPAGQLAGQRLKAFNSADLALLNAFKAAHDPNLSVENELALLKMTGGLEVLRITQNGAYRVSAILREKDGDRVGIMSLEVDEKKPSLVKSFSLSPMPVTPDDLMPKRLSSTQAWHKLVNKTDKLVAEGRFSGVFAVAREGKLLHAQSWAYANQSSHLKNTMQTRFRVGSMYKMLTAVATLQLVEQGRIALDAPLARYLPNYPNKALANQVTMRHLLTHTGGTGDIFTEEYAQRRTEIREHADYLRLFGKRDLAFVPGSKEEYSNYAYVLLGAILEEVTGKSYHQLIQESILQPVGMNDTGTEPETSVESQIAVAYTMSEKGLIDARDTLPWRGTAAGGGYSTAHDLIRFAEALLQGKLLSPVTLAQATQAQTPSQLYGYGFQLGGSKNARFFGHIGGADGMSGALRIYPATGDILVSLSNYDPPTADELVQYYGNRMPLSRQANAKQRSAINQ